MAASASPTEYFVWSPDKVAHGPINLATLLAWADERRITADTWIFFGDGGAWKIAAELPELRGRFTGSGDSGTGGVEGGAPAKAIETQALRRVRILAALTDAELARFAEFVEAVEVPEGTRVVKQGERDDTLYLILQGAMSVRVQLAGAEAMLTSLGVGECFGDLALLDKGPRSADVVALCDSVLVSVSSQAFERLSKQATEVATPILRALDRTLTERIRADNQRYWVGVAGVFGQPEANSGD